MTNLTPTDQSILDHAAAAPMLAQVERWAAVNSGTGNLAGLKTVDGLGMLLHQAVPGFERSYKTNITTPATR